MVGALGFRALDLSCVNKILFMEGNGNCTSIVLFNQVVSSHANLFNINFGTKECFCIRKSSTPTGLVWNTNMAAVSLGSLNNDDGDGNENGKKKNNWFRLAKQKLCTCITLFSTFLNRRCPIRE